MDEQIKRTYYSIIARAWQMMKTDMDLPPSVRMSPEADREWSELLDKYSNDLVEQYKGTPFMDFACSIANACLSEVERIAKRKEGVRV